MPSKDGSRLQFTEAELDGGCLKEHDRAKEREADRAAMRKDTPSKTEKLKRRIIDEKSGAGRKKKGKSLGNTGGKSSASRKKKGKSDAAAEDKSSNGKKKKGKSGADSKPTVTAGQLQFEENRPKPPSKLSHAVKDVPVMALSTHLHHEINKAEAEDENVGVESVHRLEQTAEGGGADGDQRPLSAVPSR